MVGLYKPLGWVCTALFWSGGSIAPPNKQEAEPEKFMCGEAAANAICATDNCQLALKRGLHIAMGGNGRIN